MRTDLDARVLVLAATRKDASLTQEMLAQADIAVEGCLTFEALVTEIYRGAAVVVIVEEALSSTRTQAFAALLSQQPAWSDLPVLIVARPGADSGDLHEALGALGNVTLLERPLRVATLLSAVQSGLRARERQYQIRTHLADHARTAELLRQADRRKDEFLATLGHELRNPLAPLVTGLQLLKSSGHDAAMVGRLTTVMDRQVQNLTRLVDDLLELSRITRGLIEVRRVPMDLVAALQSALDTSGPAIEAAGLTLHLDIPNTPVLVDGDMMRLTQVCVNLLGNAAKYTNAGGHVWFTLRTDRKNAIISVRDDGIGIPPDQLQSIFDMFTQVDRSTRRSQGGLGVGLTLVNSLITQHQGQVEARSEGPDRGSEFVVTLPLAAATVSDVSPSTSVRPIAERRVLIVDDNVDAANMLGQLLESLGATVSVTYNAQQALAMFREFHPDVVLLDIGMPGMDGYEVARAIRKMAPGLDSPRLVALTGWGQARDRQDSRRAGFNYHMVKPPDVATLRDVIMAH
jgi:signal transduction histidine kinase